MRIAYSFLLDAEDIISQYPNTHTHVQTHTNTNTYKHKHLGTHIYMDKVTKKTTIIMDTIHTYVYAYM